MFVPCSIEALVGTAKLARCSYIRCGFDEATQCSSPVRIALQQRLLKSRLMWRLLKGLWGPKPAPHPTKLHNFTQPTRDRWASFEGGDNFDARFSIRGCAVARGDQIFVRMRSGLVARFSLFSVLRDFTGQADWRVRGCILGYWKNGTPSKRQTSLVVGRIQPDPSKLAYLQIGFTKPTSEFWKILARNEACSLGTNRLRAGSHL
jgi:hypothetical protein